MKRKRINAVLERSASGFLALMMLFGSINASVLAETPDTEPTSEPAPTADVLQETVDEMTEENQPTEEDGTDEVMEDSPAVSEETQDEATIHASIGE